MRLLALSSLTLPRILTASNFLSFSVLCSIYIFPLRCWPFCLTFTLVLNESSRWPGPIPLVGLPLIVALRKDVL